jgi:hypothetical protein
LFFNTCSVMLHDTAIRSKKVMSKRIILGVIIKTQSLYICAIIVLYI